VSARRRLRWSTALVLAGRELRSARARFAFVVVAVALGVGALTGVRSFSQSFRGMLLTQARALMAGDISLRAPAEETPEQSAALAALAREGVISTRITESVSMAQAQPLSDPVLTTLKAVDPRFYPFAGAVTTTPPGALAKLDDNSVLASPDLLLRTGLAVGATLSVGGENFRIAGVDQAEPDRLNGGLGIGPRLLMTPGGLRRTGILQLGSQISSRLVFKLGSNAPPLGEVEARLRQAFRRERVEDFRHGNPTVERALDHSTTFLSLISLMALVIGGVGVASAMHAHLQARLDSIATMKVLGARTAQILRIYGLQTLGLGLAGGGVGLALSAIVARVLPALVANYFPALPKLEWHWWPAIEGLGAGVLITLLFTVPTLLQVRSIKPGLILRRHVNAGEWHMRRPAAWLSGMALAAGVAALAIALSDEPWRVAARDGGYFVAALLVAMAALAGVTWLLLLVARAAVGRWPRAPLALRHGMANLYRPGSLAQAVMMALGVGVMFTLTVFLLQRALLGDLRTGTPRGVANVFLIDIPQSQTAAVMALLEHQAGLENAPEILQTVRLRLPGARREISAATFDTPPSGVRLVQGGWRTGAREVAVSQALANAQRIRIGDRIEDAPVTAIFQAEPHRMVARVELIASPGVLKNLPATVNGGVRVAPAAIPGLERDMYAAFPTVTVVNIADVIERVEQVVDQIALVVHFIAFFAVFAGAIILASSVAGTRFRRMREIAILKTCGGTKGRIAAIFSTEFLLLGGVAGSAGCLLAVGFTWVIVHRLLEVPLGLSALPCLAAIAGTAALAVAAGWAACARLLSTKPLEILRAE